MSNESRKILETSLALLLGFEVDDVLDVIDHLLTFDSKEDLLEHLGALLGRNDNDVITFVDNIVKFQNGQDIVDDTNSINDSGSNRGIARSSANVNEKLAAKEVIDEKDKRLEEAIERQRQEEEKIKCEREERKKMQVYKNNKNKQQQQKNGKQTTTRSGIIQVKNQKKNDNAAKSKSTSASVVLSKTKTVNNTTSSRISRPSSSSSITDTTKTTPSENNSYQIQKKQQILPKQGQAKYKCSCYGTIHTYIANCLHCGYILCKKEGYGYCPYCSNLVEETIIIPGQNDNNVDDGMMKAILHKERLLEFDRNSASRTKVYDSQSDYYSNSTSNWLTEEEQLKAALMEEERVKEIHSRKHFLNLNVE